MYGIVLYITLHYICTNACFIALLLLYDVTSKASFDNISVSFLQVARFSLLLTETSQ